MITRVMAEKQLALWLAASEAVAEGQSYTIATENGSRSLTRANLETILKQIQYWEAQLKRLGRRHIPTRGEKN